MIYILHLDSYLFYRHILFYTLYIFISIQLYDLFYINLCLLMWEKMILNELNVRKVS